MKKIVLILAALCGSLGAQTVTTSMMAPMIPASPLVTGSPYSATETRHSLQVLGDGTRIERTDTTQVARDSVGRTRTENDQTISIHDPIAGVSWILDKARKTANRMPAPIVRGRVENVRDLQETTAASGPVSRSATKPVQENLGTQVIEGVAASGTRSTITIPAGEIGNDRDIHIVNERWYSDVLQVVVKTSNSDPRFGTTDFELTNISQAPPDPSLFEVPAGYTVNGPQILPVPARMR